MTWIKILILTASIVYLEGCQTRGPNPVDPYEPINRKIFAFNDVFDKVVLQPPAKLYVTIVPAPVRAGVNNVYMNINLIPTVINDVLQADFQQAIKDTWRFIINSGFGIAGIFDPAAARFKLPRHSNDLGLTFAHWGDQHSPYLMIPFLGPSTLRDWMGTIFEYTFFTPYPYIASMGTLYGVLSFRYVDLRSQMLDNDRLLAEAIDRYALLRDAYLQHRYYLLHPEQSDASDTGALYVEEDAFGSTKAPIAEPTQ